jgi:hypothetical protein
MPDNGDENNIAVVAPPHILAMNCEIDRIPGGGPHTCAELFRSHRRLSMQETS